MTTTRHRLHLIRRLASGLAVRWRGRAAVVCLLLLAMAGNAHAQQEDTRRLLEQGALRQSQQREQQLLDSAVDGERPSLTVNGTTYRIEHNANDVGQALYLMLQNRQWQMARQFLAEYETLPERDPLLLHYARGVLARVAGDHTKAVSELNEVLALKPDFLLARLELARTLFEDQRDGESEQLFDAIAASLDDADERNAGVRATVAVFQQALRNRRSWEGTFSLGPQWSDNVNRTSASRICLFHVGNDCLVDRQTPEPITAAGLDYDAALNRRQPLSGHHGVYLRSLLYGQSHRDAAAYNEASFATQAGYSYRSARHSVALAPSFDYYAWGNRTLYAAWGAHAEWSWTHSRSGMLKVELDWKDLRYRNAVLADNYDGASKALYATYFRALDSRWTLFGGLDISEVGAPLAINAYLQRGARLGASLQWPAGINTTLMGSARQRRHGAYSALLEQRREDNEQYFTLIVRATRWALGGFTPVLTLRRNVVRSNVDWLYSYDKHTASLKLERAF